MKKKKPWLQSNKELIAEHEWWAEVEQVLPWKLHGWDHKTGATFFTSPTLSSKNKLYDALVLPYRCDVIELTGTQKEQIMEAVRKK